MTFSEIQAEWKLLLQKYVDGDTSLDGRLEVLERLMLDTRPATKRLGLLDDRFSRMDYDVTGGVRAAPSLRDAFEVIRKSEWRDAIADKDSPRLRPFVWDILDQDGIGSCASESISGMIMCRREIQGLKRVKLNPLFAYGRVNGGSDRGSTLADNMAFAQRYGIASEAVWPRSKGWRATPSEEAYEDALRHRLLDYVRIASTEEFGSALLYGIPVYFGYPGHAIFAVNPIDENRFMYANSWDESWGDGGFGTLSYSSISWGYGAYGVLAVTSPNE